MTQMANKTLDRMTRSADSRGFQCERPWRAPRHRSALRYAASHAMPHQARDHSIDRELLEAALPHDRGAFDVEDQFQCYAFMWLQFECCTCGRTEMFEDADYPGLRWII